MNYIKLIIFVFIATIFNSCSQKYTKEQLNIDKPFIDIFNALQKRDTLLFISNTKRCMFVIHDRDSMIRNGQSLFINPKPHKELSFKITKVHSKVKNEGMNNLIFVDKDPKAKSNYLSINVENFIYNIDSVLPEISVDTVMFNGKKVTNYYRLETQVPSLIKSNDDITVIYLTIKDGIIAYQIHSGELWFLDNP